MGGAYRPVVPPQILTSTGGFPELLLARVLPTPPSCGKSGTVLRCVLLSLQSLQHLSLQSRQHLSQPAYRQRRRQRVRPVNLPASRRVSRRLSLQRNLRYSPRLYRHHSRQGSLQVNRRASLQVNRRRSLRDNLPVCLLHSQQLNHRANRRLNHLVQRTFPLVCHHPCQRAGTSPPIAQQSYRPHLYRRHSHRIQHCHISHKRWRC